MPLCMLYTNLNDKDLPDDLEMTLAEEVAKVLKKPMDRVSVTIMPGLRMLRLQSKSPCCHLQIHSIGVFDEERNPAYTTPILNFLKSQLKVEEERVVVQYLPLEVYNIGQVIPLKK